MMLDDIFLLVVVAFISGAVGTGVGYAIRGVQVSEYIWEINENMKIMRELLRKEPLLNCLPGLIIEEKENDTG